MDHDVRSFFRSLFLSEGPWKEPRARFTRIKVFAPRVVRFRAFRDTSSHTNIAVPAPRLQERSSPYDSWSPLGAFCSRQQNNWERASKRDVPICPALVFTRKKSTLGFGRTIRRLLDQRPTILSSFNITALKASSLYMGCPQIPWQKFNLRIGRNY